MCPWANMTIAHASDHDRTVTPPRSPYFGTSTASEDSVLLPPAPAVTRTTPATTEHRSSAESEAGVWGTYRPLLRKREWSIATMALTSFVAGIAEAVLLVVVANLALAIGSRDRTPGPAGDLGSLGSLDLSIPASFVFALGLAVGRLVFQLLAARTAAKVTAELNAQLRAATFADFAAASWAEQSRRGQAEIADLLGRHVARISSSITIMAQAISTGCMVAALLVSAVVVDPVSAALLVMAGGLLFTLLRPLTTLGKRISRAQLEAGVVYSTQSLEAIETSLEMRSFGVTAAVAERLRQATDDEVRPTYRALIVRQLVQSAYQTAIILLLLAGLFAVYALVDRPLATLGAIVIILVRALNQAGGLQNTYHSLVENIPFVHRLGVERAALRASSPSSGQTTIDAPGRLRFEHVTYSYEASRLALADVSFEVERGEAIGIIGPSGSGKSTLVQLLLRLREPDTGRYLLDGVDASEIEDDSWFRQIAFVPQESKVLDDTIAANIAFYRSPVTREDIETAARRAHIHDDIVAMPDGYDTVLGTRGGALSGGQRQRISIARALLRDPSILVLDEPTSALDMRSESLVHETFTELKGRVTIFAIAHRLSTLNSCDRIMVLQDGRIQAFGTRDELQRDSAFYRDALQLSQIRS